MISLNKTKKNNTFIQQKNCVYANKLKKQSKQSNQKKKVNKAIGQRMVGTRVQILEFHMCFFFYIRLPSCVTRVFGARIPY